MFMLTGPPVRQMVYSLLHINILTSPKLCVCRSEVNLIIMPQELPSYFWDRVCFCCGGSIIEQLATEPRTSAYPCLSSQEIINTCHHSWFFFFCVASGDCKASTLITEAISSVHRSTLPFFKECITIYSLSVNFLKLFSYSSNLTNVYNNKTFHIAWHNRDTWRIIEGRINFSNIVEYLPLCKIK